MFPSSDPFVLSFEHIVTTISHVDAELVSQASRAINASLTIRNWVIGLYVAEYEQQGADRASYGAQLIQRLSERLVKIGVSRVEPRELRRYRQFYLTYPELRMEIPRDLLSRFPIVGRTASETTDSKQRGGLDPHELLYKLSFSHISELLNCEDLHKRKFYELECSRGNWSVRELRRQLGSLYYERSQLSTDTKKISSLTELKAERASPSLSIRNPYVFEFLGLRSQEVMSESHLEDQLLDRLHDFLLEMGNGFCFEARQRRILIGDTQYFVDLVFYHRILKCHVLVELKLAAFSHENIGQLNTYVTWYRRHMMAEGDNPPIGILLCTEQDHALVEYALPGLDNSLFVSKYQLELPKKEEIRSFLEAQIHVHNRDASTSSQRPL